MSKNTKFRKIMIIKKKKPIILKGKLGIGFLCKDSHINSDGVRVINKIELMEVSISQDDANKILTDIKHS